MATTSGDISTLVFKRDISLSMENYVLDFQMLRVLDEIEGTRDVAAIAARLDMDIPDVKATFARLFQQRLILPARTRSNSLLESNPNSPFRIPETESAESISDPIPEHAHETGVDEQGSTARFSDTRQPAQEDTPERMELSSTPADSTPEENSVGTEGAPRLRKDTKESPKKDTWNWPEQPPASFGLVNEGDTELNAGSYWSGDSGDLEPASGSASAPDKDTTDIFSITRTVDRDGINARSNIFASTLESKQADAGLPFAAALQPDGSGRQEDPHPQENIEAIEHFEEGLELLRRNAFKEALHQFEMALELDPQNRLCRANIQRIQEKLTPDEE